MSALTRTTVRVVNAIRSGFYELAVPSANRVPFLDGLRTIAVLLVVNHHVSIACDERYGATRYTKFQLTSNGWIGVDLFFVLSGFFIGTQLWKELSRTGTILVPAFMWRRTLRIWPLYFFIFAVVLCSWPQFGAQKQYGWGDLVFLTNYLGHGVVLGGWSLSTEEQFYLLAPMLLLLFRNRSLRWFRWMLAGLWSTEIAVRVAEYVHFAGHFRIKDPVAFGRLYYPFHTHSDGLIAGMIVANLIVAAQQPGSHPWKGLLAHPWLVLVAGLGCLTLCYLVQSETLNFVGLALLFAAVVWWGIHGHQQWMNGWMFYLGSRLSFGMYLIHPYLIGPAQHLIERLHPHANMPVWASPLTAIIVACASALLACITFFLVEHPFLLLRTAMLRKKTAVPLVAH